MLIYGRSHESHEDCIDWWVRLTTFFTFKIYHPFETISDYNFKLYLKFCVVSILLAWKILNVWNCACMFRNFNRTHVIFWLKYHLLACCYAMKGSWLLGWRWGHLKVTVSDRAREPKLPLNDAITIAIVVLHCDVMVSQNYFSQTIHCF